MNDVTLTPIPNPSQSTNFLQHNESLETNQDSESRESNELNSKQEVVQVEIHATNNGTEQLNKLDVVANGIKSEEDLTDTDYADKETKITSTSSDETGIDLSNKINDSETIESVQ